MIRTIRRSSDLQGKNFPSISLRLTVHEILITQWKWVESWKDHWTPANPQIYPLGRVRITFREPSQSKCHGFGFTGYDGQEVALENFINSDFFLTSRWFLGHPLSALFAYRYCWELTEGGMTEKREGVENVGIARRRCFLLVRRGWKQETSAVRGWALWRERKMLLGTRPV